MIEKLKSVKANLLRLDREGGFAPSASVQLAIVLEEIGKLINAFGNAKTTDDINVANNRVFAVVAKLKEIAGEKGVIKSRGVALGEIASDLYSNILLAADTRELVGDDWLEPDADNEAEPTPKFVHSTSDERTANNSTRKEYRILSDDEKEQMGAIKDMGEVMIDLIMSLDGRVIADPSAPLKSRDLELAREYFENGVMRAVRHITA